MANYIKETQAEMKHVKWPSKKQVINYTTAVVVLSLLIAAYVGALDVLFTKILSWVISNAQ